MSSHDTSLTRIDALPRLLGGNYAKLIAPVSICMLVVVWSVGALTDPMEAIRSDRWIESGNRGNSTMADSNSSAVVDSESKADSLSLGAAIVSALIAVATLTVLTLIMLLLYKYHCTFILIGWLAFSCFFLFTTMMYTWLHEVLLLFRVPHDWITISILLWNISVVGAVSLFCYAHPTVRQGYNLLAAILTSWSMTSYPSVLVWSILLAIATYDIIAVMCPFGPLRLLIELAQRRQEVIPGFIYDSGSETSPRLATDDGDPHTSVGTAGNPPTPVPLIDRISQPYKLGLGDFIFYCLLVGKAQSYGGVPWTFCFITILAGMIATLFSLFFFRDVIHALPALPLSIYAAMATFFCAQYAVAPLAAFSSAFVLPL